jgi:hypothetical protein
MSDHEHVFLVAVVVSGPHERPSAEWQLHDGLTGLMRGDVISEWWVAEDDRRDGSDNDSAVFVPKGEQVKWRDAFLAAYAAAHTPRRRWFSKKGGQR